MLQISIRPKRYVKNPDEEEGLTLTPFRKDLLGSLHELGGRGGVAEIPSLPKMCYAYSTTMELGTAIPYIKKIQRIYESHDTHFNFY